jgi:hypothetical protein
MASSAPYLSVVVTTRNDGHGGNPLERFQAFVNNLTAQCRRMNIPAELIVVEWNPPADRPRLRDALKWPLDSPCEIRIIEVPAQLHRTLKHPEAFPLYQMIGKNVGIRRARGQFVLSTNADILLSNDLAETIAARALKPGVMYRVDRHDVDADVPPDGTLDELLEYCRTHQIRKHTRWGTFPVDRAGEPVLWPDDIVESGAGIQLGGGWHMRERVGEGVLRWAAERADVVVEPSSVERLLNVEVQSNPLAPDSIVHFSIMDASGKHLQPSLPVSNVFTVPSTVQVRIPPSDLPTRLVFEGRAAEQRDRLDPYELRDHLIYRVRRIYWDHATTRSPYTLEGLRVAVDSRAHVQRTGNGVTVRTAAAALLYAVEYGPMTPLASGPFHLWITLSLAKGRVAIQLLGADRAGFVPSTSRFFKRGPDLYDCEIVADVEAGKPFWAVISNAREDNRPSQFTVLKIEGSAPQERVLTVADAFPTPWTRWKSRIRRWVRRGTADPTAPSVDIADVSGLESATSSVTGRPEGVGGLLVSFKPENLHLNACGDFQLMSREHWLALQGFAEFEMYSMHIDGLLGYAAHYAGVVEYIFHAPACAYHIEHGAGSGWTPEGQDKLWGRLRAAGIEWLDGSTVTMLASFMKSVGRPLIFNGANWGFAQHQLPETVLKDDAVIR